MKIATFGLASAAAVALLVSQPVLGTASAADAGGMYRSVTGAQVVEILREVGFDASLGTDNEGDPMIEGRIEGQPYQIYFYRCNKNMDPRSCLDLQFHSTFAKGNTGFDTLNKYNRDNRFGQAFFDKNGRIGLDMSATLEGGVSRQHIKEVIDWWKVTLNGFPEKLQAGGE